MIFDKLAEALRADRPVALVTRLDGPHAGAKLLVFEDETYGDLGTPGLNFAGVPSSERRPSGNTITL